MCFKSICIGSILSSIFCCTASWIDKQLFAELNCNLWNVFEDNERQRLFEQQEANLAAVNNNTGAKFWIPKKHKIVNFCHFVERPLSLLVPHCFMPHESYSRRKKLQHPAFNLILIVSVVLVGWLESTCWWLLTELTSLSERNCCSNKKSEYPQILVQPNITDCDVWNVCRGKQSEANLSPAEKFC